MSDTLPPQAHDSDPAVLPPTPSASTLPPIPADTGVPLGTPPPRRRGMLIAILAGVLVVAVVIVLVVAGSGSEPGTPSGTQSSGPAGGQTYAANGVSLRYPSGWIHGPTILARQTKTDLWSETFAPQAGNPNGVVVTQYQLTQDLSDAPTAALEAQLKTMVEQSLGGEGVSDVTATTVGALPGYEVSFTTDVNGGSYTIELTLLFVGLDQYNISCQSTGTSTSAIDAGCQQIKDSFQITGAGASP